MTPVEFTVADVEYAAEIEEDRGDDGPLIAVVGLWRTGGGQAEAPEWLLEERAADAYARGIA